jgi:hypothetical protein
VLHVICRGTRFSATSFLSVKSSAEVWYTFLAIWVYAYLGPPHELLVDQGTEVTSEFFRARCVEMGIHLVFAPVESHSSLGLVQRMHGPFRRIYHKLLLERTADRAQVGPHPKEHMLTAATKALNDTAGVNGLVATFLVFGALSHVILDVKQDDDSFPTQSDRMHMMSIARDAAEKHVAVSRLAEAENHTVPSGDYLLSPGEKVLVFREKDGWTRPATFLDRVGGSVTILFKGRKTTFPNTGSSLPLVASTVHMKVTMTTHRIMLTPHLRMMSATHLKMMSATHLRMMSATHLKMMSATHLKMMSASHWRIMSASHWRMMSASHLRMIRATQKKAQSISTPILLMSSRIHMKNALRKQSKRKLRAYSVATCLNLWMRAQSPPTAISWAPSFISS